MEYSYDQLNTEFVEIRKVSLFIKLISFFLSINFIITPLVQMIPGIDYLYNIYYYCIYGGCLNSFGPNCFPFF